MKSLTLQENMEKTFERILKEKQNNDQLNVKIVAGHLPVGVDLADFSMAPDSHGFGRFSLETRKIGCELKSKLTAEKISSSLVLILDDTKDIGFSPKSRKMMRKALKKKLYIDKGRALIPRSYRDVMKEYALEASDLLMYVERDKESLLFSEMSLFGIGRKYSETTDLDQNNCTVAYHGFIQEYVDAENDFLVGFIPQKCKKLICDFLLEEMDTFVDSQINASHFFLSTSTSIDQKQREHHSSNKYFENKK